MDYREKLYAFDLNLTFFTVALTTSRGTVLNTVQWNQSQSSDQHMPFQLNESHTPTANLYTAVMK